MAANRTQLTVEILTDATKAAQGLNEAASGFERFASTAKKAAVGAFAGFAVGDFISKAVSAASDLQQAMGGVDAVFKQNAAQVHAWASDTSDSIRLPQAEFEQLATVIGSQLKNAGVSMDQLGPKTRDLIQLGADLGARFGKSTSQAVEALSSALKGEMDPIEAFGITLNANAIKAEEMALGLDTSTAAAEQSAKAQATLSLIMRQLYFDGTYIRIKMVSPVPSSGVTVSACNLLLEPVRWHQTNDDDSTEVSATWLEQLTDPGPPVTQTPTQRFVSAIDPVAEAATGKRRISVTTQLATEAGAQATANAILARNRTPGWRISGLKWTLNPYELLSPDDLDIIMRMLDGTTRMGLPIVVNELPSWTPIAKGTDAVAVFLEGGRFTNTDGYWTLDLLVSDASSQGQAAVDWQDQPSAWLWNQYAPDIEWAELTGVTI